MITVKELHKLREDVFPQMLKTIEFEIIKANSLGANIYKFDLPKNWFSVESLIAEIKHSGFRVNHRHGSGRWDDDNWNYLEIIW